MSAPHRIILAGPNGSGKSSIYTRLSPLGEFVNADVIEAGLPESLPSSVKKIRAGKLAVARLNELIRSKADFVFETTLSGRHALRLVTSAKAVGYHVGLIFVALDSAERNVKRVEFRVRLGGHDIPVADILRRYDAAFRNLPAAISIADESIVIDNSSEEPRLLFTVNSGEIDEPRLQESASRMIGNSTFRLKLYRLVKEGIAGKLR